MSKLKILRIINGRFYGLDFFNFFFKGNGRLRKVFMDILDSSMMKKTGADSKAKGKKPGSTCDLLG